VAAAAKETGPGPAAAVAREDGPGSAAAVAREADPAAFGREGGSGVATTNACKTQSVCTKL
jgi:hypothetical protein